MEHRLLVISDDAEFVNSLVQSWCRQNYEPEFTVANHDDTEEFPDCAVIVADGSAALARMTGRALLAILVTADRPSLATESPSLRLVQIQRGEGWADLAAALAQEAMLRVKAVEQVVEVERRLGESEHFAAIGRFIVDARHGLANALTSVLGNSELVLLDSNAGLRDEVRGQLETIHAMSLRMHETLQRLSSLDTEMRKNRGASC